MKFTRRLLGLRYIVPEGAKTLLPPTILALVDRNHEATLIAQHGDDGVVFRIHGSASTTVLQVHAGPYEAL